MKRRILVGQDGTSYEATAFGYEGKDVFCTVDDDCKERVVIATYADGNRACEVVNSILKNQDDSFTLPTS